MCCRLNLQLAVLHFYLLAIFQSNGRQWLAAGVSKDLDMRGHGARIELQVQNVVVSNEFEADCRRRMQRQGVASEECRDGFKVDFGHGARLLQRGLGDAQHVDENDCDDQAEGGASGDAGIERLG